MSDTEELHRVQHLILQGVANVVSGLREIAADIESGDVSPREAASELRFLAAALAHKLRGMSE